MNVATINGYVRGKIYYGPDSDLAYRVICRFEVASTTPCNKGVSFIPVKCVDFLADKCMAELSEGCYVEIIGELVKVEGHSLYLHATSIIYKKPKERNQIMLRTTEFFQTYKPEQILKRINQYGKKK